MGPYCDELGNDFDKLVAKLKPTLKFYKEAKQAANVIFEQLKREGPPNGVRIGRTKIAGSVGKGTAIVYKNCKTGQLHFPDLDLVVFVNEWKPPFKEVYEIFKRILRSLGVTNINQTRFSLQFDIKTESFRNLSVDLLAAENSVVNPSPFAGYDIGEVAAEMTSQCLDKKQKNALRWRKCVDQLENKLHNSAFAEITVKIIRDLVKDDFVLEVVFLAKYWMRNIGWSFPAKSTIAEAIAIWAQQTGGRSCVISGFKRFLDHVENFHNLDICLTKESTSGLGNYFKPMIRDPGNRWNNLAEGMPFLAGIALEQQAKKTLVVLQEVRNREGYSQSKNAVNDIFQYKTISLQDWIIAILFKLVNDGIVKLNKFLSSKYCLVLGILFIFFLKWSNSTKKSALDSDLSNLTQNITGQEI